MIRRRLPLPPDEPRCPETRAVPCCQVAKCARGTEPHAKGRDVVDYSIKPRLLTGVCGWLLPIRYAADQPVQPRVHDAPEGLC